jgi:dihydrolipoamide dehydrogenase
MPNQTHDLVIIGAGPGGYVAAIRAAQLGLNVACVEKEPALGGTCLRIGCIPSKALLESSERYWEAKKHFASHGVGFNGLTLVVINDQETTDLKCKFIIIATGSKPASLPGVALDGDRIASSTEALSYQEVPKHLVVIGGGYIGLELGSVWQRLGARVTVLEYLDRILFGMDAEIATEAKKLFEKQGIEFRLRSKVTAAKVKGNECVVECEAAAPMTCDRVLVAVGRVPNTEKLGLEQVKIELHKRGLIPVKEHFETSVEGIYAIGDVITGPMLAHKAEEEGIACVEHIVTGQGHVNYDAIAGVIYTQPEIASVGKTEDLLKEVGVAYRKGVFTFRANARARTLGHVEGMIKILADPKTDRILGVHIIGPHAGDLINEAAVAIAFGASSEDLARTCHVHPTLGEALREAALAVAGRTINS